MVRQPPRSSRTDTIAPYTPLVRAAERAAVAALRGRYPGPARAHCGYLPCQSGTLGRRRTAGERGGRGVRGLRPERISGTTRALRRPCGPERSAEQPSELQSLNRNSYAVFCLKTTKRTKHTTT